MKYLDISQTIRDGMKKYPSVLSVSVRQFKSLKKGDSCNLKVISFGSHTGTHIDAPSHILKQADNIRINDLLCRVIVTEAGSLSDKNFLKMMKS